MEINYLDPVHQDINDHKWYFWDETSAGRLGPYDSENEAKDRMSQYVNELNYEGDQHETNQN